MDSTRFHTSYFFFTASKNTLKISCVLIKKKTKISQILLSLWLLIGDRTLCCPIQSVIVLVIKQIGLHTRIITDQIGLHSVLLPLFICFSLPQDLLEDPCPTVRATAIHGVCRITGVFWELIPAHVIKMFLTTLVRA